MATLGTTQLKLMVDAVEQTAVVSRCAILSQPAESDFVSFADAAAGGARDYFLDITAAQDLATSSFWRHVWDDAGTTVAVKVNPYGNATASATEPHYTGNVTITEPDGEMIGGDANSSTSARMTFQVQWKFTAKPTEVTSGSF